MTDLRRPLVAALVALGCASPREGARQAASPAPTAKEEIRRVAAVIEQSHVTPVDRATLLRAAAEGIDAEARASVAGGSTAGEDPGAALDAALARLEVARPGTTDALAIGIAVKAMARSLGVGAWYLEPRQGRRDSMGPGSTPEIRGAVGIIVGKGDEYPIVLRAIPGSPAAAAGMDAGSEVRAVDDRPTSGMPVDEVARLLAGPMGSEARVTLAPSGGPAHTVVVRRAFVELGAVDCRVLGGRILYLRTFHVSARTAPQVRGFATALGEPVHLAILDLRQNQGGLLEGVTDLADAFLASGPILSLRYRDPGLSYDARAASGTSPLEAARLAVLVDGETASGAEALAAAIQDGRRGTVFGARTAGKAPIDALFPVSGGALLRLTVGRLLRANGGPIDGAGVSPDVAIGGADAALPVPSDVPCPGFASPGPVARDPAVARAAAFLMAP